MQQDYYSALARLILSRAEDDPALRKRIYAMARDRLQQQLGWSDDGLNSTESAKALVALESAIARIEAEVETHNAQRGASFTASIPDRHIEIIPPGQDFSPLLESRFEAPPQQKPSAAASPLRWILPVAAAAVVAIAAYFAVERAVLTPAQPNADEAAAAAPSAAKPHADLLLPNAYGVYALAGGKLNELEPLPFKLPDRGPPVSRTLSAPSKTRLASGAIQFVAFKRELANSAPETVTVRVIAHVKPGKTAGKQEASAESWIVRNTSYEMRVAPVEDRPAVIVMRPSDGAFVFPAGRYALMLKGTAYDFSVDGKITDPAQCVERTDDQNVIDYLPCR